MVQVFPIPPGPLIDLPVTAKFNGEFCGNEFATAVSIATVAESVAGITIDSAVTSCAIFTLMVAVSTTGVTSACGK